MAKKSVRVIIAGRVQGVSFRDWTKQRACENNLTGWVRNLSDGSVEAIFQGRAKDIEVMLTLCQIGPPAADVRKITTTNKTVEKFFDFRQLPTS